MPFAMCQAVASQTVSGIRVPWKIAPAVAETPADRLIAARAAIVSRILCRFTRRLPTFATSVVAMTARTSGCPRSH